MRRIFIVMVILGIIFYNTTTKATGVKRIDLKLQDNETNVVFLKLKHSNSLLFADDDESNLFVLDYDNDEGIKEALNVFGYKPDIYFLNNKSYRVFNNVHVFWESGLIRFRTNNYTLCVYDGAGEVFGCDFIYLKRVDKHFKYSDKFSAVFYDESIDDDKLQEVRESWVDNAIVSTDSFTILKLYENSYNILVVPSTNG